MAIKRVTIELDDSPDRARPTGVPDSVHESATQEFKGRELTATPSDKGSDETDSPDVGRPVPRAPGRTVADLIAEFVNDPRAMATILMFVPFLVFAAKVQTLVDLLYPTVTGALLNAVWFGVSWLKRSRK